MFDFLSIDWGEKRMGYAYGNIETGLIIPDREKRYNNNLYTDIAEIIRMKAIKSIIVGVPSNFSFEDTETSLKIKKFINYLSKEYSGIPVDTVNERNSTKEAILLQRANENTKLDKFETNHLAAVKILEFYFNQENTNT